MADRIVLCADDVSSILFMLGNKKRLEIMSHLAEREMSVGQIAEAVGLSQSALSQHLAKLRARKLVVTRRDKQTIYYSVTSQVTLELLTALNGLYSPRPWPQRDTNSTTDQPASGSVHA